MRVARPKRWQPWAVGLCVLALIVGAFVAGRVSVGVPAAATPADVPPPTAKVARGPVAQVVDVPQAAASAWSADVAPPAEAPRLVLTRLAVKEGAKVRPCASPASVNDVPVVVLPAAAPFFRDLAPGARGSDVTALQRALARCGHPSSDPAGTFGQGTAAAWAALVRPYAPATTSVGWRQLVQIPEKLTESTVAGVTSTAGQVLPSGSPLFRLTAGGDAAVGAVEKAVAQGLHVGQVLDVTLASGASAKATITALTAGGAAGSAQGGDSSPAGGDTPGAGAPTGAPSDSNAPSDGARLDPAQIPAGQYRLQVTVKNGQAADAPVAAVVRLRSSPAEGLSVPLAAVAQCDGGPCVRVKTGTEQRDVRVRTGLSDGRVVAVTPDGSSLAAGDDVLVSGS